MRWHRVRRPTDRSYTKQAAPHLLGQPASRRAFGRADGVPTAAWHQHIDASSDEKGERSQATGHRRQQTRPKTACKQTTTSDRRNRAEKGRDEEREGIESSNGWRELCCHVSCVACSGWLLSRTVGVRGDCDIEASSCSFLECSLDTHGQHNTTQHSALISPSPSQTVECARGWSVGGDERPASLMC